MAKAKKILALLLSVIMLIAAFSSVVSAAYTSYTPTLTSGDLKIILRADKTEVNPGDTVTFDMFVDTTLTDLGTAQFVVSYNSAQAAPGASAIADMRTFNDVWEYWFDPASSGNTNLAGTIALATATDYDNKTKINASAEDKAYFDKAVMIGTKANTGNGVTNTVGNGWNADPAVSVLTFKMKINDTVTPGEKIFIGYHSQSWSGKAPKAYIAQAGGAKVRYTNCDLSEAMVELTVASAGPAVAKSKAQVKMTPNSATTVEDAFSFRVTSVITDADWDAYFANSADSAATTNAIKSVGFVAYKGTTGFNLDTAKAVAQGTPAAGYDVATTDYIQKANDTSDAFFGCRLEITSAATRSDVTYVAFVQYLDATGNTAYAFYDAEQQALLNTNYNNIVSTYLIAHPFAG